MLPALERRERTDDVVESLPVQHGSLASDPVGVHAQHAVEPYLAVPALSIPRARAEVEPVPPEPRLVGRVTLVVLAREHQAEHPRSVVPDDEHRAVLAARRIVLERHPGPDDLARVCAAVEVWLVCGFEEALEVGAVGGSHPTTVAAGPRSGLSRRGRR